MKTLKKSLAIMLTVLMLISSAPLAGFVGIELLGFNGWFAPNTSAVGVLAVTGQCGNNVYWNYNESTDVLTISGYGEMWNYSYSGTSPFYSSNIKEIIIEDGVTTVGDYAFYLCQKLTTVILPNSIKVIGLASFRECSNLAKVNIPVGVTDISNQAFWSCYNLSTITIPQSVIKLGGDAFEYCNRITSIKVDENNPNYMSDINGVLFNKEKTELIQYPLGNDNTSYDIPIGVISVTDRAFSPARNLAYLNIPNTVEYIGYQAFDGCNNLTDIVLPESITRIENFAFSNCSQLNSIYLAEGLSYIGDGPFESCNNLKFISVSENNVFYSCDENGVLFNKDKTKLIQYPIGNERSTYAIPSGVVEIGYGAFANSSLIDITIPDGVEIIGTWAFICCFNFTDIVLPNSVTTIGYKAFRSCSNLKTINIPDSVITIETMAFRFCHNLSNIIVPSSVAVIGDCAFEQCDSFTFIEVDDHNQYFTNDEDGVLFNKNKTHLIQYPIGKDMSSYNIPDNVTHIGKSSFEGNDKLISVTIPDGVTIIDDGAFSGCANLSDITIPRSVKRINSLALNTNSKLTHVAFTGTKEEWNSIKIDNSYNGDTYLKKAEYLHLNYDYNTDVEIITTQPTCTETGKTTKVCSCGYTYVIGETAALGHTFTEWAIDGSKSTRYCTLCNCFETKFSTGDGDIEMEVPNNPDSNFVIDEIVYGRKDYAIIEEAVSNDIGYNWEIVKVFDITMTSKEGVHVQPNGTVKVKLPLNWSKNGNYKVYRVNNDGTLTDMNAYRQGSHMVFDTEHFSIYVIVEKNENIQHCKCNCHKSGFIGFIWKIVCFFWKLFKMNPVCECGVKHY